MAKNAAATPDLTADMWETFEFDYATTNNLKLNDNSAIGGWVTNGIYAMVNSGEKALLSTVNGQSDSTHTNGISRTFGATGTTNAYFDLGSGNTKAACSVSFWWKFTGTPTASKRIAVAGAASGSEYPRLDFQYNTGYVLFSGNANTNGTALTAGNWYWISIKYVQNGTCTARVFNDSGTQVGSDVTETALNSAFRYFHIPHYNAETADATVTLFWDDILMNYATAPFPFGP